jgi:two-component system, OmpR family, sensor histidine kinase QseC
MNLSIKNKLLFSLIFTLLIAIVVNSLFANLIVRHEVDEVFDAELVVTTRIIKGLINKPDLIENHADIVAALHDTLAGLNTSPAELGEYEKKLLVQVWQQDGQNLIFSSAGSPEYALAPLQVGFYHHAQSNRPWDAYVTDIPANHCWLLVGEIPDARREIGEQLTQVFIVTGFISLFLCSLIVLTAIEYGLSPLKQLGSMLRRRTLNNLHPVELAREPKELTPVISGINQLFLRLTSGLERERRFVADAAHELRTPLAVLKLQTQHLQLQAPANLQVDLQKLNESVERGHRIVEQLLLLARLDEQENFPVLVAQDCVELCRRSIAEMIWLAEQKNASLSFEISHEQFLLDINPTLLDMALRNLIQNSLRYGPSHNHIQVTLHVGFDDVKICVLDSGPGVEGEALELLTRRFYRHANGDNSGAGLGLSIVARIIETLQGQLTIANRTEGGLQVCMTIPKKSNKKTA